MYGELFGITYTNPTFLSRIYYDPHYNHMERLVNLLTFSLLPNHYDQTQEHIMIRIIEVLLPLAPFFSFEGRVLYPPFAVRALLT